MINLNLKNLILAAALTLSPNVSFAQEANQPITFEFEGAPWIIRHIGGASRQVVEKYAHSPMTRNLMTPGFGNVCRNHVVDLKKVANTIGDRDMRMTREQKFRGDGRFHVECAFDAPPFRVSESSAAPAPAASSPAVAATPAPLNSRRDPSLVDTSWHGKGEKI